MRYYILKNEVGYYSPHIFNEVDILRRRVSAEDLVFLVDASCVTVAEEHYDYLLYDCNGGDLFET